MSHPVSITQHLAEEDAPLSQAKAAALLSTSRQVLGRGLSGQVLEPLTVRSVGRLLDTPVLDSAQVGGNNVPVLRPQLARPDTTSDPRRFYGWDGTAPDADLLAGLDRWWTPSGKDTILAAGGFLVAVGTLIAVVVEVDSDENTIQWDGGKVHYHACLAGRLDPYRKPRVLGTASADYQDLAHQVLGKRVLGGEGGNFVRI